MKILKFSEKELSIITTALTLYANKSKEYYLKEKEEQDSENKNILLNHFRSEFVDTNYIIEKINEVLENEGL